MVLKYSPPERQPGHLNLAESESCARQPLRYRLDIDVPLATAYADWLLAHITVIVNDRVYDLFARIEQCRP